MGIVGRLGRLLPFVVIALLVLNTALGCWCGQHSLSDPTTAVADHVNCPPGSHGKPWWADAGKALVASRQRLHSAATPGGSLEARSFVRAAHVSPGKSIARGSP